MYFDSITGEHSYSHPDVTVSQSVEVMDDSSTQQVLNSPIQGIQLSDLLAAAAAAESANNTGNPSTASDSTGYSNSNADNSNVILNAACCTGDSGNPNSVCGTNTGSPNAVCHTNTGNPNAVCDMNTGNPNAVCDTNTGNPNAVLEDHGDVPTVFLNDDALSSVMSSQGLMTSVFQMSDLNDSNQSNVPIIVIQTSSDTHVGDTNQSASVSSEHAQTSHKCPHCETQYTNAKLLEFHMRNHKGILKCNQCPKTFTKKHNLYYHKKKAHTKQIKDYTCENCGAKCTNKAELRSHWSSKCPVKQFSCSHCRMQFRRKDLCIIHERVHTGELPYICQHCDKGFRSSTLLKQHLIIHTDEYHHVCQTCGEAFKWRSGLSKHIKNKSCYKLQGKRMRGKGGSADKNRQSDVRNVTENTVSSHNESGNDESGNDETSHSEQADVSTKSTENYVIHSELSSLNPIRQCAATPFCVT